MPQHSWRRALSGRSQKSGPKKVHTTPSVGLQNAALHDLDLSQPARNTGWRSSKSSTFSFYTVTKGQDTIRWKQTGKSQKLTICNWFSAFYLDCLKRIFSILRISALGFLSYSILPIKFACHLTSIHPCSRSSLRSFVRSFACLFVRFSIYRLALSLFVRSLFCPSVRPFVRSLVISLVISLVHAFVLSLARSFIHLHF